MDPVTPTLNTILLLITIFTNGPTVMIPSPDLMTAAHCKKKADEANTGFKFYGDRETFDMVRSVCLEKKA